MARITAGVGSQPCSTATPVARCTGLEERSYSRDDANAGHNQLRWHDLAIGKPHTGHPRSVILDGDHARAGPHHNAVRPVIGLVE